MRKETPLGPASQAGHGMMLLDGRGSELGVMVRELDGDALAATKGAGGVQIEEVSENSAAQKAGLKAGDIVVEYDGERVRSARQFTRLVRETPGGRTVKLGVLRNGQRQTVDATPDARTFSWDMDVDGDRIGRDVERGMREMERLREFRVEPPAFNFRFDDMAPMPPSRVRLGVTVEGLSRSRLASSERRGNRPSRRRWSGVESPQRRDLRYGRRARAGPPSLR